MVIYGKAVRTKNNLWPWFLFFIFVNKAKPHKNIQVRYSACNAKYHFNTIHGYMHFLVTLNSFEIGYITLIQPYTSAIGLVGVTFPMPDAANYTGNPRTRGLYYTDGPDTAWLYPWHRAPNPIHVYLHPSPYQSYIGSSHVLCEICRRPCKECLYQRTVGLTI